MKPLNHDALAKADPFYRLYNDLLILQERIERACHDNAAGDSAAEMEHQLGRIESGLGEALCGLADCSTSARQRVAITSYKEGGGDDE